MKLNRIIPVLALVIGLLVEGCTKSAGTQAETDLLEAGIEMQAETDTLDIVTETQQETVAYEPYTWEWLAERSPYTFADQPEEELFKMTNLNGWLKTQEKYSEYFHEASEYWDEDGNFTYPGSTAEDPDFIPSMSPMKDIADATMPQEVMDKLGTRELLDIANNEKAVVQAATEGCWDESYVICVLGRSATYRELLKRDDYPQVVYEFYTSIEPEEYIGIEEFIREPGYAKERYKAQIKVSIICVTEVTLVTDRVFDALDDSQRIEVIAKNQEIKEYLDEIDYDYSIMAWDWYKVDGVLTYVDSTFDAVIGAGVSSKWSTYVKELEVSEK